MGSVHALRRPPVREERSDAKDAAEIDSLSGSVSVQPRRRDRCTKPETAAEGRCDDPRTVSVGNFGAMFETSSTCAPSDDS
jgi:hypothetical protein